MATNKLPPHTHLKEAGELPLGRMTPDLQVHFNCVSCDHWWSLSSPHDPTHRTWFCPWCGTEQRMFEPKR